MIIKHRYNRRNRSIQSISSQFTQSLVIHSVTSQSMQLNAHGTALICNVNYRMGHVMDFNSIAIGLINNWNINIIYDIIIDMIVI